MSPTNPLKKKKNSSDQIRQKKKRFKQPFSLRNSLNVHVEIWARKNERQIKAGQITDSFETN